MDRNISIEKTVFEKDNFEKVIDTSFKTFVRPTTLTETTSVGEFFRIYDEIFFEIPAEGEINSHEYLIRRSSEIVNISPDSQDIQPLLDEIAQLREQLLLANEQILELQG